MSLLTAPIARAGTVHGQITLPVERADANEGVWRLDNGLLAVVPKGADARHECFVLLVPKTSVKAHKPETVTVELRGLRLTPSLIAATMGDTLELHNDDRVPHALSAEDLLQPKPTPPGSVRSEVLQRPGVYPVRDDEVPHVRGWLVVTDGGSVVRPDEHGAWKADVSDGAYTAKLFYRGTFVAEHAVDVSAHPAEVELSATGGHP
ncbi:MAG: hypothetical protein ABI321_18615 [Polyangia bacterium]